MNRMSGTGEADNFREERDSLWRLIFTPTIWTFHFAIAYAATAVTCARHGGEEAVDLLRTGVIGLTVVALGLILWLGYGAWRQWDIIEDRDWENDQGHNEDRHQFMGHAAFLLAIISFIGVVFVTLPVVLIGTCR